MLWVGMSLDSINAVCKVRHTEIYDVFHKTFYSQNFCLAFFSLDFPLLLQNFLLPPPQVIS